MNHPILLLMVLAGASAASVTTVSAKNRHHRLPPPVSYDAPDRSQAVFVGGTYAGSDPDPNIRAALAREFGKRR